MQWFSSGPAARQSAVGHPSSSPAPAVAGWHAARGSSRPTRSSPSQAAAAGEDLPIPALYTPSAAVYRRRSRARSACAGVRGAEGDSALAKASDTLDTVSTDSLDLTTAAAAHLTKGNVSFKQAPSQQPQVSPTVVTTKPRVLILHTGGTLGMEQGEVEAGIASSNGAAEAAGTEQQQQQQQQRVAKTTLRPATMLQNVLSVVPELWRLSNVDLQVVLNKDSSRVGPEDWVAIAKILHARRLEYDAFLVIHGTDTMSFTASALSYMLRNFGKPIVLTGSQLPLAAPRTDARQNLLDAIQCATASFSPPHVKLQEVAVCFGGRLLRGNRSRKVNTSSYQAFDSFGYPHLAQLGIDVAWNERALLRADGAYVPRFKLEPAVIRVPVTPGVDPRQAYGDLVARGVRGAVLEVFGVGNLPDLPQHGWVPWIEQQIAAGLKLAVVSQCGSGPLHPELYAAGGALAQALTKGAGGCSNSIMSVMGGGPGGSSMTPEAAITKLMFILAYPDLTIGEQLAGEL